MPVSMVTQTFFPVSDNSLFLKIDIIITSHIYPTIYTNEIIDSLFYALIPVNRERKKCLIL